MSLSQAPSPGILVKARRHSPGSPRPVSSCACVWLTGAFLVALAGGCGLKAPPEASAENATPSASDPNNLTYDVGRVITGEVVTHDFLVANTGALPIAIEGAEDIRLGCGCASLVPEARRLEPGSSTRVTATVHTQGLNGLFQKGGHIIWTAPNGAKRVTQITIVGELVPPLRAEPPVVRFQAKDVQGGVVKEVRFGEGVPLDWSTLFLESSSPYVKASIAAREGQAVGCLIECTMPAGLETFAAAITARVRVADPACSLRGTEVSLVVPITARQEIDLDITPKSVPVTFRSPEGSGTGRLLLRGALLQAGRPVLKSVRCEGFHVAWKLDQHGASEAAVLEVVLKPQGKAVTTHPEIEIEVEGKGIYRCPVVVMGARPA